MTTATTWRKRSGIMLCYPFEEERLVGTSRKAWNYWPVLTQPKLDGERAIQLDVLSPTLLSSTQNPIWSVPHINEELTRLQPPFKLDGELYCHGMGFDDIQSIVSRTVNQHPDSTKLEYHVFDIADNNGLINEHRVDLLKAWFERNVSKNSPLKLVPTRRAESFGQVFEHYHEYLEQNYEGVIVRHPLGLYVERRSTQVMKFKPKKSDHYVVTGWREELSQTGELKNSLGALECVGTADVKFFVGTGFTAEQRSKLWKNRHELLGKTVHVQYQSTMKNQKPRFPVFVEVLS